MIRSGSAYQYNLVCSLLEKCSVCVRHGRWEPKEEFSEFTPNQLYKWANDRSCFHVIKSGRYPIEFELARKGLAKITYINRDIRDIAVAAKYKWKLSGKELTIILDRAISGYQVMKEEDAFNQEWCLKQKYEDVYLNGYDAIQDISSFLGIYTSDKIIKEVLSECAIENMITVGRSKTLRLKQITLRILGSVANQIKKFLPHPYNKSWKLRKYYLHFLPKVDSKTVIAPRHIEPTKGIPGAWKERLSQEEVVSIENRYKDYLFSEEYNIQQRC